MNTGRTTQQLQQKEAIIEPGTLEAKGYTIKPSPRGGGFLLYRSGEKEEAIDIVGETQKWMEETAKSLNLQSTDILRKALTKAKATPKKTPETSKNSPNILEIVTSDVYRGAPDSGIFDGKAYLGVWLPAKITTEDGTTIRQIFHLLFSNGELVRGDTEALSEQGIF